MEYDSIFEIGVHFRAHTFAAVGIRPDEEESAGSSYVITYPIVPSRTINP